MGVHRISRGMGVAPSACLGTQPQCFSLSVTQLFINVTGSQDRSIKEK